MVLIPKDDLVYNLNNKQISAKKRGHAGLSGIGASCHRKLQYDHYWAVDSFHSKRVGRIFETGHNAEDMMVRDLESEGYKIIEQQAEVVGVGGHWKGHIDGVAIKARVMYLLELKTHNDKNFKNLKKKGVKAGFPSHYAQMQAYMGYKGLAHYLYVGYNKNDSEYFIEFGVFNPEFFQELKWKQVEILTSDDLLPRIGNNNQTWFECKMCDSRHVCFGKAEPSVNCRTCRNVDVVEGGQWLCTLSWSNLSYDEQAVGCKDYEKGGMFK